MVCYLGGAFCHYGEHYGVTCVTDAEVLRLGQSFRQRNAEKRAPWLKKPHQNDQKNACLSQVVI